MTSKSTASFLSNLALLAVSILLALSVGEIALRLVGYQPLYVSPERDRFWKHDSTLGWVHEPGQNGAFETEQFRMALSINQKGLRGAEYPYERTGETGRVLVLGDSFAWGYGVEEQQRFSERLAAEMGVEVINAGISGYSTDQELLWLKNEGVKYDADLVILTFVGNDIGDNERNMVYTIYYKPRYVLKEGQLDLTGVPVPTANRGSRMIYSLSQRSALVFFIVQNYFDLLSVYNDFKNKGEAGVKAGAPTNGPVSAKAPFELTIALLNETRRAAEAEGANFMIVATNAWWNGPPGATYEQFINTLREEGFHILDVHSLDGFDSDKMSIPDDGHWNQTGHAFVAKSVEAYIRENQLFNPLREEKDDHDKP